MKKTLQATYRNGTLLLSETLDPALEGAQIRVMILEPEVNELPASEPVAPSDRTADEELRISKLAVLTKWAKRRSARYASKDEGNREPIQPQ